MHVILRILHDLTHVYPLHPMVVHFPIALTGAALFFILLALWRHSEILEQVAIANLSLAAPSILVAAALGIHDNLVSFDGHAPNHDAKNILAVVLFVVTVSIAVIRWKKKTLFQDSGFRKIYVVAYFISFALAAILGFLGGIITYGF
jgi:uncharacterized membrane protein